MPRLERLTTTYDEAEDRIRVLGEVAQGEPQLIWLTRRLLDRLLPVLCQLLEKTAPARVDAPVWQEFAQAAARADLQPQAPVQGAGTQGGWVALAVDLNHDDTLIALNIRGGQGESAELTLEYKVMRQWLNVVSDLYLKAEWALDAWPGWMRPEAHVVQTAAPLMH